MKDHNDSTRLWPEESFLNVLSCTLQNRRKLAEAVSILNEWKWGILRPFAITEVSSWFMLAP